MIKEYVENIDRISELNAEEKDFLRRYFINAKESLKVLYRADSNEYSKWRRWLKRNEYLIYKIKHYNQQTLISNAKQAFDFVLTESVDLVMRAKMKNDNKSVAQGLQIINKICGLEQYAVNQINKLDTDSRQAEIKQLTTEQLKELAELVQGNIRLLSNSAERESCDEQEQDVSDIQQAIIIDSSTKIS